MKGDGRNTGARVSFEVDSSFANGDSGEVVAKTLDSERWDRLISVKNMTIVEDMMIGSKVMVE